MPDYVTLMGAEQVKSAGNRISSAADQMSRAASTINESLYRHELFMADWLNGFQRIVGDAIDALEAMKNAK